MRGLLYALVGFGLIVAVYLMLAAAAPGLRLPGGGLNFDRPDTPALLAAAQCAGTIGLLVACLAVVQVIVRRGRS